jgi:hypothetical protein
MCYCLSKNHMKHPARFIAFPRCCKPEDHDLPMPVSSVAALPPWTDKTNKETFLTLPLLQTNPAMSSTISPSTVSSTCPCASLRRRFTQDQIIQYSNNALCQSSNGRWNGVASRKPHSNSKVGVLVSTKSRQADWRTPLTGAGCTTASIWCSRCRPPCRHPSTGRTRPSSSFCTSSATPTSPAAAT